MVGTLHAGPKTKVPIIEPYMIQTFQIWGNTFGGIKQGADVGWLLDTGYRIDMDALWGWKDTEIHMNVNAYVASLSFSRDMVGVFGANAVDNNEASNVSQAFLSSR